MLLACLPPGERAFQCVCSSTPTPALLMICVGCVQDSAEFGRIGRYYAAESMLVWDEQRQVSCLLPAGGPSLAVSRQGPAAVASGRCQGACQHASIQAVAVWYRHDSPAQQQQ